MSSVPSCPICGVPVVRKSLTGPVPTYCSRGCRAAEDYARRGAAINALKRAANEATRLATVKTCPACWGTFTPTSSLRQRFCNRACNNTFFRDSTSSVCSAPECDRPRRAKGLCNMHYKAVLRSEGRITPAPWTDARKDRYHRRRALKLNTSLGNPVLQSEIAERDGFECGLCAEPVDMSIAWPDPLSPSIDHVIPLSKGGIHDPSNVQLAHLFCNLSKGDRAA